MTATMPTAVPSAVMVGAIVVEAGEPDADITRGIYRHCKGAVYQVLMVAISEATGRRDVIYSRIHGDGRVWSRPVSDFTDIVDVGSGPVPRFAFMTAR